MHKISVKVILIIIITVMNILLLYKNAERQNQINHLRSQLQFSFIDRIDEILNNSKLSHPQIEIPNSKLSLMFFFPETSCPICIEYEVPKINSFFQKYDSNVVVYVIGKNDSMLDIYGPEFPYSVIHPSLSVFDNDLKIVNPFALLIDSDGNIHSLYLSEIGNPEKSTQFWLRIEAFFNQFFLSSLVF